LHEKAANRTAATNDSAGYGDLTAQPGREQAQIDASQAQQNQISFANQQLKEQFAGPSVSVQFIQGPRYGAVVFCARTRALDPNGNVIGSAVAVSRSAKLTPAPPSNLLIRVK
jgi:hypothetical protein